MMYRTILLVIGLSLAGMAQAGSDRLAQAEADLAAGRLTAAQAVLEPLLGETAGDRHARVALALARLYLRARCPEGAGTASRDVPSQGPSGRNPLRCPSDPGAFLAEAAVAESPALRAAAAETRGRWQLLHHHQQAAALSFNQALADARSANAPALLAGIQLNRLRFLPDTVVATRPLLREVEGALAQLRPSAERSLLSLELGRLARRWDPALAWRHLSAVAEGDDPHVAAQALEVLAEAYREENRPKEGLLLVDRALERLAGDPAPELRLYLEWRRGRLLAASNRPEEELAAYRRAVAYLETIRADLPPTTVDGQGLFDVLLGPLYRRTADLLLRKSGAQGTPEGEAQALRREARRIIERFRAAELQDYFKHACAVVPRELTRLGSHTATLYPIVLEERLELLLEIGGTLQQEWIGVSRTELVANVRKVADALRFKEGRPQPLYPRDFQWLYGVLIAPLEERLEAAGIDTLVYVPDDALRALPIAALLDNRGNFLVDRYAVVTVPGLTLLGPGTRPQGTPRAFLAGLGEPGPVVEELPERIAASLLHGGAGGASVRGGEVQEGETAGRGRSEADRQRLRERLLLPNVAQEMADVAALLPGTPPVENEAFRRDAVSEALAHPYRIVHLATHGFFTGDPEQSFLLTYDHTLKMSGLASLLRSESFDETPVELLTLSACRTAAGDERSPLGLTGVAIQSGARSVLGSLWPVSDEATPRLLKRFYTHLIVDKDDKAKALQRAQQELKQQFPHPAYWAAFILVGNWN